MHCVEDRPIVVFELICSFIFLWFSKFATVILIEILKFRQTEVSLGNFCSACLQPHFA